MTATCQCDQQPEHPCGAKITQEDLLCGSCRTARKTPGALCLSVTIGCCTASPLPHVALFLDEPPTVERAIEQMARPLLQVTAPDAGAAVYPWRSLPVTWSSGNAGAVNLS